jgi:hypothetical protein
MDNTITLQLVFDSNGSLDEEASLASAAEEIHKYKVEKEEKYAHISFIVGNLFDEHKGATFNMPYLTSEVLRRLNPSSENFKVLSEMVGEYLKKNSQGKKLEDGSVENPNSLFVIAKGKGGGCFFRAHKVPVATEYTK